MPQDDTALNSGGLTPCQFKYFLDLPAEIRLMVYDLVLGDRPGIEPYITLVPVYKVISLFGISADIGRSTNYSRDLDIDLLLVNKQVSMEASQRFYGINVWAFQESLDRTRLDVTFDLDQGLMVHWYVDSPLAAAWSVSPSERQPPSSHQPSMLCVCRC